MTKYIVAILAISVSVLAAACGGGEAAGEGAKTPEGAAPAGTDTPAAAPAGTDAPAAAGTDAPAAPAEAPKN